MLQQGAPNISIAPSRQSAPWPANRKPRISLLPGIVRTPDLCPFRYDTSITYVHPRPTPAEDNEICISTELAVESHRFFKGKIWSKLPQCLYMVLRIVSLCECYKLSACVWLGTARHKKKTLGMGCFLLLIVRSLPQFVLEPALPTLTFSPFLGSKLFAPSSLLAFAAVRSAMAMEKSPHYKVLVLAVLIVWIVSTVLLPR